MLEAFGIDRQKLNATQIAERTGLSRTAARRYLRTLKFLGYLETDEHSFWLTHKVLRFSSSYLSSAHLPKVAQPILNILCMQTALTFSIVVLDDDEIVRLERYLDAIRSNLLFAKGVILVEGDAELILIPELFKEVFGISLDEIGVSLISIGSTGFENVARIFHEDRIKKNCAILTDLDASIVDLPADSDTDDAYQKHCRASEKKGSERSNKKRIPPRSPLKF